MFNPSFDRTEWRSRYDHELVAAAKESNHELCIALGERLADYAEMQDELVDVIAERNELEKRCSYLRNELNELHEALKSAGAEAV